MLIPIIIPKEYREFLRPIVQGRAEAVYGSGISGGKLTRAFKFRDLFEE
jgi:hypothetical protein